MSTPKGYAIFDQLRRSGMPLQASARFGDGLAAALWERNGSGRYRYDPPNHHTLSLCVAGGEGFRRLRGRNVIPIYGKGSLWIMPAGATTDWDASGSGRIFHFYIPTPTLDRRVVETLDVDPKAVSLRDEGFQSDAILEGIIRRMLLPLSWYEPSDRIAASSACELITAYLAARCAGRAPQALLVRGGLAPVVLRRVLDYVEAQLEQGLSLRDLAAVAGLSPYHFARVFKRSTGSSPHRYVLRRRIERAKRHLAAGELPLAAVALTCGFGSQSHFTAHFRTATGLTPRQFARCR
jgi:AraC family transcriptional regulator